MKRLSSSFLSAAVGAVALVLFAGCDSRDGRGKGSERSDESENRKSGKETEPAKWQSRKEPEKVPVTRINGEKVELENILEVLAERKAYIDIINELQRITPDGMWYVVIEGVADKMPVENDNNAGDVAGGGDDGSSGTKLSAADRKFDVSSFPIAGRAGAAPGREAAREIKFIRLVGYTVQLRAKHNADDDGRILKELMTNLKDSEIFSGKAVLCVNSAAGNFRRFEIFIELKHSVPVKGNMQPIKDDVAVYEKDVKDIRAYFGHPLDPAVVRFFEVLRPKDSREKLSPEEFMAEFAKVMEGVDEKNFVDRQWRFDDFRREKFENWDEARAAFIAAAQPYIIEKLGPGNADEVLLTALGIPRNFGGDYRQLQAMIDNILKQLDAVHHIKICGPARGLGIISAEDGTEIRNLKIWDYPAIAEHLDIVSYMLYKVGGAKAAVWDVQIRCENGAERCFKDSKEQRDGFDICHYTIEISGTMKQIRDAVRLLDDCYDVRRAYIVKSISLYAEDNLADKIFTGKIAEIGSPDRRETDSEGPDGGIVYGRRRRPGVHTPVSIEDADVGGSGESEKIRLEWERLEREYKEEQKRLPYYKRDGWGERIVAARGEKETFRAVIDVEYVVKPRGKTFAAHRGSANVKPLFDKTRPHWKRTALAKGAHTDLVDIYPMLRCPHCDYGIPLDWFTKEGGSKCRICGGELRNPPPPDKIKRRPKRTPHDLDGDGISNEQETANGLNPRDPGDALLDHDRDGFSNRYEIKVSQTNIRDGREHPPLWRRLRYRGVRRRVELPIRILSTDFNSPDRKNWEASIKYDVRDPRTGAVRSRLGDYRIGDTIKFDGRNYEVIDFGRTIEKDKRGIEHKKDSVTLRMIPGNKEEKKLAHELKVVMGEKVYSPDARVVLEDIGVPFDPGIEDEPDVKPEDQVKRFYKFKRFNGKAVFELRVGERFALCGVDDSPEGKKVPREVYELTNVDEKAQVAQLSRVKTRNNTEEDLTKDIKGDLMLVTEKSGIPEVDWVAIPTPRPASGRGE